MHTVRGLSWRKESYGERRREDIENKGLLGFVPQNVAWAGLPTSPNISYRYNHGGAHKLFVLRHPDLCFLRPGAPSFASGEMGLDRSSPLPAALTLIIIPGRPSNRTPLSGSHQLPQFIRSSVNSTVAHLALLCGVAGGDRVDPEREPSSARSSFRNEESCPGFRDSGSCVRQGRCPSLSRF